MKAEHRKELQTNFLADRMGRLLQGVRSGPKSKSSAAVWVLATLTIGTLALWYYAGARSNHSPLWVKFEEETLRGDTGGLNKLAYENPGTLPARAARFQRAQLLLEHGLTTLYSRNHDNATAWVNEARNLFEQLSRECIDDPVMTQQALMGAAKAEESLGRLDQALGYYEQVVQKQLKSLGRPTGADQTIEVFQSLLRENIESAQSQLQEGRARLLEEIKKADKDSEKRKILQNLLPRFAGSETERDSLTRRIQDPGTALPDLLGELNAKLEDATQKPELIVRVYPGLAEAYPQILDQSPANFLAGTQLARIAANQATEIKNNRAKIESFYKEMNQNAEREAKNKKGISAPPGE